MHQQARAGIDFDDSAALFFQRPGNIFRHQVDTGNIQAHHARSQRSCRGDARVHQVGDVDGDIAVTLD